MAVYMTLALIPLLVNPHRISPHSELSTCFTAHFTPCRGPNQSGQCYLDCSSDGISIGLQMLPFGSIPLIRYCRLGWEFYDRYKTYRRLGDAWILVTSERNWLYVAQGQAAMEIFARGRDFGRPVFMLGEWPSIYGQSTCRP